MMSSSVLNFVALHAKKYTFCTAVKFDVQASPVRCSSIKDFTFTTEEERAICRQILMARCRGD